MWRPASLSRRGAREVLRELLHHLADQLAGRFVGLDELDAHARLVDAGAARLRPGHPAVQLALAVARELQKDADLCAHGRSVVGVHEYAARGQVGPPPAEGAL